MFTLAASLFVFGLAAREGSEKMMQLAVAIFGRLGELRVQGDEVPAVAELAMTTFISIGLPVVLATALAAILAGGVQSGFQLTPDAMKPSFERFDPIAGLGRIFGK